MATFGVLGADSDLNAPVGVDDPLARGVVKHAAVIVDRIFFLVSIGVRIEMNHREFTELAVMRA